MGPQPALIFPLQVSWYLGLFSGAVIKYRGKSNMGKKRLVFTHSSTLQSIKASGAGGIRSRPVHSQEQRAMNEQ